MAQIQPVRCPWCGKDPLYVAYHDEEWGVPDRDSRTLWEKLVLDGFQAGLSWITILRKRENFRRAFFRFDPEKVAHMGEKDIARLLGDPGIVRHRSKIEAAIHSARLWLAIEEKSSFSDLVWSAVGGRPIVNRFTRPEDVPSQSRESVALSKALGSHGFRYCGPTIAYAFMQACGLVNDHLTGCFRYAQIGEMDRIGGAA